MRVVHTRTVALLAGLLASACATTALPPELADPAAHVRPVTRGADHAAVTPVSQRPVTPGVACEVERHAALLNSDGARLAFAECLVRTGDTLRAASVVEAYLPGREDILERARIRTDMRAEATRHSQTAVLDASIEREQPPMAMSGLRGRESAELDEAALNGLLETAPDDPWVWMALGREYERQGRDAEAVDAYLLAKSLDAAK